MYSQACYEDLFLDVKSNSMQTPLRTNFLGAVIFLLLIPAISFTQAQTFNLPTNKIGHRELFLNVSNNDILEIHQFQINEQYSITISSLNNCEVELIPISTSEMEVSNKENILLVKPRATTLSFAVKYKACKRPNTDIALSFFCMSCPIENGSERMDGIMTDPSFSPDDLVRDVLIGGGCFEVQQVTPIGLGAMGKFSNGESSIGFSEGVIIATGPINIAEGPNNVPDAGLDLGGGSDVDLFQLAGGTVQDASGVQFRFTPTEPQIAFNYAFASEEYCEWSPSSFNDVFGFFISGPGINGGFSMNGDNIAVLPGSGITVSISNVNQSTNSAFFVDNTPQGQVQNGGDASLCTGVIAQDGIAPNDCQFDGFTGTLTAIADVIPCETYTIRLLVGDVTDGIYDSAVFLEANSFNAGGQGNVAAQIPGLTPDGFGIAYEGCSDGFLVFQRIDDDLTETVEITFSIDPTSTAIPGVDFSDLPSIVTILPGETEVLVPFNVFADFIVEGQEFITINIDNACTCTQSQLTIVIDDVIPLEAVPEEFSICDPIPIVLTAQPTGGATPYTYQWDLGATTPTVQVVPFETETYMVTITDACGSTVVTEHIVNVNGTISASMLGDIEICGEFPEGWIDIELFGNGPWDLTYAFNGQQQPTIENIDYSPYSLYVTEPGVYQLILVSSFGCQVPAQGMVIVEINEIDFITEPTDPSCAGTNDGSINLIPIDGTPGYQYEWTGTTQANSNPSNLAAGTYQVTITDAAGCLGMGEIVLAEPDSIEAEVVDLINVNCFDPNGGSFNVNVSGGVPNYNVSWSGGLPPTLVQSNLGAGTYTGIVTDSAGCSTDVTATIIPDLTPPTAAASPIGILTCTNDEILLSGMGSSTDSSSTYQWFDSDSNPLGTNIDQLVTASGSYTLVVTNSVNGCTAMATTSAPVDDQLPVAAILSPAILDCDTDAVLLDANGSTGLGPITYNWIFNNSSVGTDSLLNTSQPGTYTLIITDSDNGCTAEESVEVLQNITPPDVDAGTNQVLTCTTNTVTLSGSGSTGSNFIYSWLNENMVEVGTDLSIEVEEPGIYTLIITNSTTGCTAEAITTVTPDADIPAIAGMVEGTITCDDLDALLNGAGSATGPNITYTWVNANNSIVGNDINATVSESGLYTLTVLNTANGCEASTTVMVPEDLAVPAVDAGPDATITCDVTEVNLTGSTADPTGHTFEWLDENNNSLGTEESINVDQAGNYTFIVTGPNGCTAEDEVTVGLNADVPVADAGDNFILTCLIDQYTIGGSQTTIDPDLQYEWLDENNVLISTDPTFTVNYPGTFTLYVTDPISNCESFDLVIVEEQIELPALDIGSAGTIDCNNESYVLGGTGTDQGTDFSHVWTNENNDILSSDPFYETTEPGIFTLTVTNTLTGCIISDDIIVPGDLSPPIIDAGPDGLITCSETSILLTGSANSSGGHSFEWLDENNQVLGNSENLTVVEAGTYTFNVTGSNGCISSDEVIVDINNSMPVADAGANFTLTCQQDQYIIGGSGTTIDPEVEYQWFDENNMLLSTDPTFSINYPGTFTLYVSHSISNCESFDEVTINETIELPDLDIGAGGTLNCNIESFILGGTGTAQGNNFTYSWTNQNNVEVGTSIFYETFDPGIYTLTVLNTTTGCETSDQISIVENMAAPTAEAGPNGVLSCDVDFVQLNAAGSSNGSEFIYEWFNEGGVLISNDEIIEVDQTGQYTLVITNVLNGCSTMDNTNVTPDINLPVAVAGPGQILNCDIGEVTLNATGSSTASGSMSIQWLAPDGSYLSDQLTIQTSAEGIYTLVVNDISN